MSEHYEHTPVLLGEVLMMLAPHPGGRCIDGTIGGGGHASALLQRLLPGGCILGIDADLAALDECQARFSALGEEQHVTLVHANIRDIGTVAHAHGFEHVDGILFDLGVSSHQLDTPSRGFSFRAEGPLDMRSDSTNPMTAATMIAEMDEQELADCLYRYGEERASRRIARAIKQQWYSAMTTTELAAVVERVLPRSGTRGIHPATRTFQALRIAVNRELDNLEAALPQAVDLLRPGGRLAVISFHSLEDRLVKWFFRNEAHHHSTGGRLGILTKKPLTASREECAANPRSRSAKLRVAERLLPT